MYVKYYAVRNGRKPGVYATWPECQAQVKNFSGAQFKSFASRPEAEAYVAGTAMANDAAAPKIPDPPYAFVDGSYNPKTKVSGWGGFLVLPGGREIELTGSTDRPDAVSMRNVAGEIMGCMDAVQHALGEGLDGLTILYDYTGIECWATGAWSANKPGTMAYQKFMQAAMSEFKLDIKFQKVEAHTGIPGNERADQLAKRAVGL